MFNTATLAPIPRGGLFSRMFTKVLENRLPRKFKRLIYVSSILGLIQQMQDPDMELVTKLNETFKLAEYPDAFAFPMYIKSVIWKDALFDHVSIHSDRNVAIGDLIKEDLNSRDCAAIGEYFATHSPSWLKYGAIDFMVNDVVLLIQQLKHFNLKANKPQVV
jgi:hypothetical protein